MFAQGLTICFIIQAPLSAPEVEISDVTCQSLTVSWTDINVNDDELEFWRVVLKSDDNLVVRFLRTSF